MLHPLIILGGGYVGRALQARFPSAVVTHRPGSAFGPGELPFLLDDPGTWNALSPADTNVVWTFPAKPLVLVERFVKEKLAAPRSLIVLGSTSAYVTTAPDEMVTEATRLDLTQERVAGEEFLRKQGATILQLAGIFGPDRTPLQWLNKGLIKNANKRVNLIHVNDIVAAIEAILATPLPGERINASNGLAPTWAELVEQYKQRGLLAPEFELPHADPGLTSKRISNQRFSALLPKRQFQEP